MLSWWSPWRACSPWRWGCGPRWFHRCGRCPTPNDLVAPASKRESKIDLKNVSFSATSQETSWAVCYTYWNESKKSFSLPFVSRLQRPFLFPENRKPPPHKNVHFEILKPFLLASGDFESKLCTLIYSHLKQRVSIQTWIEDSIHVEEASETERNSREKLHGIEMFFLNSCRLQ